MNCIDKIKSYVPKNEQELQDKKMYLQLIPHRNQSLADKIITPNSDIMYAGIVSGNNVGEIWADDVSNPAFCMVWSEYLEGFHFMGSRCDHINIAELQNFIENTIIQFLKSKNIRYFEFSCDSKAWMPIICEMLSSRKLSKAKQYVYTLARKSELNTDIMPPVGYDVFEINEHFVNNRFKHMENYEIIKSDIINVWGSVSKFLECGKGFAAVQNDSICSIALTRFLYNDIHSIGAETYDPHKKKGLSAYLSMALFKDIIRHGANIWWDCMESNVASQKTAQKTGLIFDYEYEIAWFNLNDEIRN